MRSLSPCSLQVVKSLEIIVRLERERGRRREKEREKERETSRETYRDLVMRACKWFACYARETGFQSACLESKGRCPIRYGPKRAPTFFHARDIPLVFNELGCLKQRLFGDV